MCVCVCVFPTRLPREQHGCGAFFDAVEDCLNEHAHDWRKCQEELKLFRECEERWRGAQGAGR